MRFEVAQVWKFLTNWKNRFVEGTICHIRFLSIRAAQGPMSTAHSMSERADELEHRQMEELAGRVVVKSFLHHLADGERTLGPRPHGRRLLMGDDPRLPPMPEKPTLLDFFRLRFAPTQAHLLQSANLAQRNGLPEKMVLACLLHDIAVVGFIRTDHGYLGRPSSSSPTWTRK